MTKQGQTWLKGAKQPDQTVQTRDTGNKQSLMGLPGKTGKTGKTDQTGARKGQTSGKLDQIESNSTEQDSQAMGLNTRDQTWSYRSKS